MRPLGTGVECDLDSGESSNSIRGGGTPAVAAGQPAHPGLNPGSTPGSLRAKRVLEAIMVAASAPAIPTTRLQRLSKGALMGHTKEIGPNPGRAEPTGTGANGDRQTNPRWRRRHDPRPAPASSDDLSRRKHTLWQACAVLILLWLL